MILDWRLAIADFPVIANFFTVTHLVRLSFFEPQSHEDTKIHKETLRVTL